MSTPSTDARGRRYTIAQKAEILAFIDDYNREKGKGGQLAAHRKFGIAQLTLKNWMRHGVANRKSGAPSVDRTGKVLERLQHLHALIEAKEGRLESLRAEYQQVKAGI